MRLCGRLSIITMCLLAPASASAEGASLAAATAEQKGAAQKLFLEASAKFDANDFAGALAGFQASYDTVKSPNARLMVGRTMVKLGRLADGYKELAATEREAREAAKLDAKYAATEKGAREDQIELKAKLGVLRVDLAGRAGTVTVSGKSYAAAELSSGVLLDPGEVEVSLDESGKVESKKVSLAAGAEQTVSFAAAAPPPPTPIPSSKSMHPFDMGTGQQITGGVFLGLGAVGMGLFAAFGAMNQSTFSDLEEQCPNGRCPAALAEDIDSGKTNQTAANGSVIAGSICLAIGAGLLIPTFFASGDAKGETAVRVGPGFMSLERSF